MDANARHRTKAEEAAQGIVTNAGKELSKAVESLNQINGRLAVPYPFVSAMFSGFQYTVLLFPAEHRPPSICLLYTSRCV